MKRILFSIAFILLILIPIISVVKYVIADLQGCRVPETYTVEVVKRFERDPSSFTQGLFVHNGRIYESFGNYGSSGIKSYQLGEINPAHLQNNDLDVFAEGASVIKDEIIQISWKKGIAYRYDNDLNLKGDFIYQGDGWGLTTYDEELVMSDGSYEIQFRSPKDFKLLRKIEVKDYEEKVDQLNELEMIGDEIWANIWLSDEIIAIDPDSGCVMKKIDASSLWEYENPSKKYIGGVLNGIAYNSELGHIYLTGKYWQNIFHIKLKNKK